MKIVKEVKGKTERDKETEGKTLARAYCHTEGQWIDEWDTHFETTLKDKSAHELVTSHLVTIHYK